MQDMNKNVNVADIQERPTSTRDNHQAADSPAVTPTVLSPFVVVGTEPLGTPTTRVRNTLDRDLHGSRQRGRRQAGQDKKARDEPHREGYALQEYTIVILLFEVGGKPLLRLW